VFSGILQVYIIFDLRQIYKPFFQIIFFFPIRTKKARLQSKIFLCLQKRKRIYPLTFHPQRGIIYCERFCAGVQAVSLLSVNLYADGQKSIGRCKNGKEQLL